MTRWLWVYLAAFLLVSGCGSRPSDIFLPIIVGEATAAPTILDTPGATPTDLPVTRTPRFTMTPARSVTPATVATPTVSSDFPTPPTPRTAITRRPATAIATRIVTSVAIGTGTPGQFVVTTPVPRTPIPPTTTPQTIFQSYLALVLSQLKQAQPATPTSPPPTATATPIPAPIVVTPTPRPPTITPSPTSSPTPFFGTIRLLDRDPVSDRNWIPVVAYADPDSLLEKSWSSFYTIRPNSDLVRIYANDDARIYDPVLALTEPDHWAEGVCMTQSTMVGVQFWGDENDGWARVLVDGVERWRGNTYGRYPNLFVRFLEIRDLHAAPHVVRVEPLGQAGTSLPGGDDHVSIYAIVCGLPVRTEIYVPILQR